MAMVKKKIWPEFFEKIVRGEKEAEVRLADFDLQKGDTLVLEEYNPITKKYTGRRISKKVKNLNKIKPTKFYTLKDIEKFGFYLIELD